MWIRQAFLIANKDFKQFARDRFGFLFAMAAPVLFATAFFFFLGDIDTGGEGLTVYLSTREPEAASRSRQIMDGMVSGSTEDMRFEEIGYEDGRSKTEAGEIDGMIAFPAGFTNTVYGGGPAAAIEVVLGGSSYGDAVLSGLGNRLTTEIAQNRAGILAITELSAGSLQEIAGRIAGLLGGDTATQQAAEYRFIDEGDVEPPNAADFTIPGYLVMFVFFAAAFTAETLARERENGTLERLLTAGAGRAATLGGKFLTTTYRGVLQVTLLWVVGIFGFGINLGDAWVATILVSALMMIASAAFGVMLATFVKTVRSASSVAVLVPLVAAPIGGCWWPLFIVPEWMQALAKFTPHGWANTAFNRLMLFGGDFGSVALEMVALVCFAVGFGAIAVWRFRVAE